MKLILYILLCSHLLGAEFRVLIANGRLVVEGATNVCLELMASVDFKNWSVIAEFTNSIVVTTNQFLRARLKSFPPMTVSPHSTVTGSHVLLSGFATKPLDGLWLTNGSQVVQGRMLRQQFAMEGERAYVKGCQWQFEPFNVRVGQTILTAFFTTTDGITVSTNISVVCDGDGAATTVTHPANGAEVVGNSVILTGFVDKLGSEVRLDRGNGQLDSIPVRQNGDFLAKFPIEAQNHWKLICRGQTNSFSFRQSAVAVSFQTINVSPMYGERGCYILGAISDTGYDILFGTNLVRTTNGTFRARVPMPEGGLLPYSIKPKASFAPPAPVTGIATVDFGCIYYPYAFFESQTYGTTNTSASSKTSFRGFDYTNSYFFGRTEGKKACYAHYLGIGEDLMLDEFEEEMECGIRPYRATFPRCQISNYQDDCGIDRMGNQSRSGCLLNTGGDPLDPKLYQITVGLELDQMNLRFGSEITFENIPTDRDWKVGGHLLNWTFVAYNGHTVDVSPEFPPLANQRWCQYRITASKTLAP